MEEWIKLTHKDSGLAKRTAEQINADHPGAAKVEDGCCFITQVYYGYCKQYVLSNCSLKQFTNKKKAAVSPGV